MREVPCSRGMVALVDDEDFAAVSARRWSVTRNDKNGGTYYAIAGAVDGQPRVLMHRLLMQPRAGESIDHINGNGLDNRRKNLRRCSCALNAANRVKTRLPCTSRFKGVNRRPNGTYRAYISQGGFKCLGTYRTEDDAARAYDRAARERFGEFARVNFDTGESSDE